VGPPCVRPTSGPTAGRRAAGVAVLERVAQPPVDHPGCSAGADELPVALEPDFTAAITGQVAALGVAECPTPMQRRGALAGIDVHHHHRGVQAVWAPSRLGVPAGLHQP